MNRPGGTGTIAILRKHPHGFTLENSASYYPPFIPRIRTIKNITTKSAETFH